MPEAQGVMSQEILAFLNSVEAAQLNLHSIMLVRHGFVIAEGWSLPYEPGCRRYVYSLTKSFTSTAVGLAVAEGLLAIEDRVISFFPDDLPDSVSNNLAAMRVRDLLTLSTGHSFDTTLALVSPDAVNWAQTLLALPVDDPPGTHFLYNTGASYLLSAIVQKVSGQTALDYLTPRLFQPLGITDVTWDTCPRGISAGGWGMSIRTEDIAKFGVLYLQKGNWRGRQLLASRWIEEATRAQVRNDGEDRTSEPTDWRQGYGYQFWRCRHDAYRADGAAGQFCVVMPDQDAVLVITSETQTTQDMQAILDLAWHHLLPAMQKAPLIAQPAVQEQLREKLASLRLPLPAAQPLPVSAPGLSGQRYFMAGNEASVRCVSFAFDADQCSFVLEDEAGEHRITCGNGRWIKNEAQMPIMVPTMMDLAPSLKTHRPVKVAAQGTWTDPQTYMMTWRYLETPHADTVTCHFLADTLHLRVTSSVIDPTNPFLMGKESRFIGVTDKGP
jgi:CubicO group peptidase (beta-lactamase class C family)